KRYVAVDDRSRETWSKITAELPNYALLADSSTDAISEIQRHLAANEALVLFLDTSRYHPPGETFFFVVTATQSRWGRVKPGNEQLQNDTDALRCGLDATLWLDATTWAHGSEEQARLRTVQMARRQRCETLIDQTSGIERVGLGLLKQLPFDAARAHQVYR